MIARQQSDWDKALFDKDGLLGQTPRRYAWLTLMEIAGMDQRFALDLYSSSERLLIYHPTDRGAANQPALVIRPGSCETLRQLSKNTGKGELADWRPTPAPEQQKRDHQFFSQVFISSDAGLPACRVDSSGKKIIVCGDVLMETFFMLSRFEECVTTQRDRYARFSSTQSAAGRYNFLDIPIVDIYANRLFNCIKKLCPNVERQHSSGKILYSCDVDVPYDPITHSVRELALRLGADLLLRHNTKRIVARLANRKRVLNNDFSTDPNYQFDWIMDQCEANGLEATFFFLSSSKRKFGHGYYSVDDPPIRALISRIKERDHAIGLHGAFGTYSSSQQIKQELDCLTEVGVEMEKIRSRQHYLQWDPRSTPDHLENAGVEEDWSGGYHDRPGFRFGTAHNFKTWSWLQMRPLKLEQVPLIMMECSLLDTRYGGLPHFPESYAIASRLKQRALQYHGNFSLLWHNSYLQRAEDKKLLSTLLSEDSPE